VYCGPPGAGKATNLAWLHRGAKGDHRGELHASNVGRDHTLWFDFEPLHPTVFRDFTIRFLVVTVTGKTTSGATHRQVMRGADGVVFVADSSPDRLYDTLTSYRETAKSLEAHQLEAGAVPVVLQYNKRDVAHALSRAELDEGVNPRKHEVFLSVATLGDGVLETFQDVLRRTLASIAPQNESLPLLKGMEIDEYGDALIQHLYGRRSFKEAAPTQQQQPREEDSRPIPVLAMPVVDAQGREINSEVSRKLSLADFEAALAASKSKPVAPAAPPPVQPPAAPPPPEPPPQPLAQPAAQPAAPAAAQPASQAPAFYEGLRAAIVAADALAAGAPFDAALTDVMTRLVGVSDAVSASVLLPAADGGVHVAASHPLSGDPVASSAAAARIVAKLAGRETSPRLHEPVGIPGLADAVRSHDVGRVLSAPLRSPRGLHGVLLLYLVDGAEAPAPELIAHVGNVAQALSLALRYR